MGKDKITIKELSDYCGVSTATISRVINNNGRFSEETRSKVLEAIKTLGYIPNNSAKALRTKSSRIVGIFVNTLNYEITSDTVVNLQQVLFNHGYVSVVCNAGLNNENESDYFDMLLSMDVCGIIIIASRFTSIVPQAPGIPLIYIFRNPGPIEVAASCVVETDDFDAGYQAGAELIRLGCKRLAAVHVRHSNSHMPFGRDIGFLRALYDFGLPYDESLSITVDALEYGTALKAVNQALEEGCVADGYFCSSDLLALSTVRSLELHGFCVPDEVKVIGCNDMSIAMLNNKPLTTIRHKISDICNAAVENLDLILGGESLTEAQQRKVFGVDLIRRATT